MRLLCTYLHHVTFSNKSPSINCAVSVTVLPNTDTDVSSLERGLWSLSCYFVVVRVTVQQLWPRCYEHWTLYSVKVPCCYWSVPVKHLSKAVSIIEGNKTFKSTYKYIEEYSSILEKKRMLKFVARSARVHYGRNSTKSQYVQITISYQQSPVNAVSSTTDRQRRWRWHLIVVQGGGNLASILLKNCQQRKIKQNQHRLCTLHIGQTVM